MAKNNKGGTPKNRKDIQNVKLKQNYFKNVSKSVSYAVKDLIKKDLLPETYKRFEQAQSANNYVRDNFKNSNQATSALMNKIKSTQYYKDIQEGIKNAKDDLKSGNIYNKEREKEYETLIENQAFASDDEDIFGSEDDMFGGDDDDIFNVDSDDDDIFVDDSDGDDFSDISDKADPSKFNSATFLTDKKRYIKNVDNRKGVSIKNYNMTSKGSGEVDLQIATISMENANRNTGIIADLFMKHTEAMSGYFESVNTNIATIVETTSSNINPFIEQSTRFYEDNINTLKGINETLTSQFELTKAAYQPEEQRDHTSTYQRVLAGGVYNLSKYKSFLMDNLNDMLGGTIGMDIDTAKGFLDMVNEMGGLKSFMGNPLGGLLRMGMGKLIPGSTKTSLDNIDNLFRDIPYWFNEKLLGWAKDNEDKSDSVLGFLGRMFGVKHGSYANFETGTDRDKLNQAKAFSTQDHQALVKVIPHFLSQIAHNTSKTKDDEEIYNYETGTFVSKKEANRKFNRDIQEQVSSDISSSAYTFGSRIRSINESLPEGKKLDDKAIEAEVENQQRSFNQFFLMMSMKGLDLDFKDYQSLSSATKSEFNKVLTEDMINNIWAYVQSIKESFPEEYQNLVRAYNDSRDNLASNVANALRDSYTNGVEINGKKDFIDRLFKKDFMTSKPSLTYDRDTMNLANVKYNSENGMNSWKYSSAKEELSRMEKDLNKLDKVTDGKQYKDLEKKIKLKRKQVDRLSKYTSSGNGFTSEVYSLVREIITGTGSNIQLTNEEMQIVNRISAPDATPLEIEQGYAILSASIYGRTGMQETYADRAKREKKEYDERVKEEKEREEFEKNKAERFKHMSDYDKSYDYEVRNRIKYRDKINEILKDTVKDAKRSELKDITVPKRVTDANEVWTIQDHVQSQRRRKEDERIYKDQAKEDKQWSKDIKNSYKNITKDQFIEFIKNNSDDDSYTDQYLNSMSESDTKDLARLLGFKTTAETEYEEFLENREQARKNLEKERAAEDKKIAKERKKVENIIYGTFNDVRKNILDNASEYKEWLNNLSETIEQYADNIQFPINSNVNRDGRRKSKREKYEDKVMDVKNPYLKADADYNDKEVQKAFDVWLTRTGNDRTLNREKELDQYRRKDNPQYDKIKKDLFNRFYTASTGKSRYIDELSKEDRTYLLDHDLNTDEDIVNFFETKYSKSDYLRQAFNYDDLNKGKYNYVDYLIKSRGKKDEYDELLKSNKFDDEKSKKKAINKFRRELFKEVYKETFNEEYDFNLSKKDRKERYGDPVSGLNVGGTIELPRYGSGTSNVKRNAVVEAGERATGKPIAIVGEGDGPVPAPTAEIATDEGDNKIGIIPADRSRKIINPEVTNVTREFFEDVKRIVVNPVGSFFEGFKNKLFNFLDETRNKIKNSEFYNKAKNFVIDKSKPLKEKIKKNTDKVIKFGKDAAKEIAPEINSAVEHALGENFKAFKKTKKDNRDAKKKDSFFGKLMHNAKVIFDQEVVSRMKTLGAKLFGEDNMKSFTDKFNKVKGETKGMGKKIAADAGIGLVAGLFLPTGPVLGGIIGAGIGLASKSKTFNNLLFGDDKGDDKNAFQRGMTKIFKEKIPNYKLEIGAGLLGSLFLPGGPIVGGLLGAFGTHAIKKNKERFNQFLFGDYDSKNKTGRMGILTRMGTKMVSRFLIPIGKMANGFAGKLTKLFDKSLLLPFKKMGFWTRGIFTHLSGKLFNHLKQSMFGKMVKVGKDFVGQMFKNVKDTAVDITKKFFGGLFKGLGRLILGKKNEDGKRDGGLFSIVRSPLRMVGNQVKKSLVNSGAVDMNKYNEMVNRYTEGHGALSRFYEEKVGNKVSYALNTKQNQLEDDLRYDRIKGREDLGVTAEHNKNVRKANKIRKDIWNQKVADIRKNFDSSELDAEYKDENGRIKGDTRRERLLNKRRYNDAKEGAISQEIGRYKQQYDIENDLLKKLYMSGEGIIVNGKVRAADTDEELETVLKNKEKNQPMIDYLEGRISESEMNEMINNGYEFTDKSDKQANGKKTLKEVLEEMAAKYEELLKNTPLDVANDGEEEEAEVKAEIDKDIDVESAPQVNEIKKTNNILEKGFDFIKNILGRNKDESSSTVSNVVNDATKSSTETVVNDITDTKRNAEFKEPNMVDMVTTTSPDEIDGRKGESIDDQRNEDIVEEQRDNERKQTNFLGKIANGLTNPKAKKGISIFGLLMGAIPFIAGLKKKISSGINFIKDGFTFVKSIPSKIIKGFSFIKDMGSKILTKLGLKEPLKKVGKAVKDKASDFATKAKNKVTEKINKMKIEAQERRDAAEMEGVKKQNAFQMLQTKIREKFKTTTQNATQTTIAGQEVASNAATNATVAAQDIQNAGLRGKFRMGVERTIAKAKQLWGAFTTKAESLIPLAGEGIRAIGRAISAIPFVGKVAAVGAIGAGIAGIVALKNKMKKKAEEADAQKGPDDNINIDEENENIQDQANKAGDKAQNDQNKDDTNTDAKKGNILTNALDKFKKGVSGAVTKAGNAINKVVGGIKDGIGGALKKLGSGISNVVSGIGKGIKGAFNGVKDIAGKVKNTAGNVIESIKESGATKIAGGILKTTAGIAFNPIGTGISAGKKLYNFLKGDKKEENKPDNVINFEERKKEILENKKGNSGKPISIPKISSSVIGEVINGKNPYLTGNLSAGEKSIVSTLTVTNQILAKGLNLENTDDQGLDATDTQTITDPETSKTTTVTTKKRGLAGMFSSIGKGISNLFGFGKGGDKGYGKGSSDLTPVDPNKAKNDSLKEQLSAAQSGSYYSQVDPTWGNKKYASNNMSTDGCAPTAMAMVASDIRKETVTPDMMAQVAEKSGDTSSKGTSFNFIKNAASNFGFNANQNDNVNITSLKDALKDGEVVINGRSDGNTVSPFTNEGHYVVATGMNSDGTINIKDPRGAGYNMPYDPKLITQDADAMWRFDGNKNNETINGEKLPDSWSGDKQGYGLDNQTNDKSKLQQSLVNKMFSVENKLDYSQAAGRSPDKGYSDCSNTVEWAYKNILGVNSIGGYCGGYVDNPNTVAVDVGKLPRQVSNVPNWQEVSKSSYPHEEKLEKGDILLFSRSNSSRPYAAGHTEMYIGDGKMIGHGGPGKGPYVKKISERGNRFVMAKRYKGFTDGTATGVNLEGSYGSSGGADATNGSVDTTGAASSEDDNPITQVLKAFGNFATYMFTGKDPTVEQATAQASSTGGIASGVDGSNIPSSNIEGSDVAKNVWNYFTSIGYSPEATAGIMGNMRGESGMDPAKRQVGGPAAGIVQWERFNDYSTRWGNMANYAKSKGKDWTDLGSQLEFVHSEIPGTNPWMNKSKSITDSKNGQVYNSPALPASEFKNVNDVANATVQFEKGFERAGKPNLTERIGWAKGYYDMYNGTQSTSNNTDTKSSKKKKKGSGKGWGKGSTTMRNIDYVDDWYNVDTSEWEQTGWEDEAITYGVDQRQKDYESYMLNELQRREDEAKRLAKEAKKKAEKEALKNKLKKNTEKLEAKAKKKSSKKEKEVVGKLNDFKKKATEVTAKKFSVLEDNSKKKEDTKWTKKKLESLIPKEGDENFSAVDKLLKQGVYSEDETERMKALKKLAKKSDISADEVNETKSKKKSNKKKATKELVGKLSDTKDSSTKKKGKIEAKKSSEKIAEDLKEKNLVDKENKKEDTKIEKIANKVSNKLLSVFKTKKVKNNDEANAKRKNLVASANFKGLSDLQSTKEVEAVAERADYFKDVSDNIQNNMTASNMYMNNTVDIPYDKIIELLENIAANTSSTSNGINSINTTGIKVNIDSENIDKIGSIIKDNVDELKKSQQPTESTVKKEDKNTDKGKNNKIMAMNGIKNNNFFSGSNGQFDKKASDELMLKRLNIIASGL